MIPNEYLYYYYHARQAVEHILASGQTRGESVTKMNNELFRQLRLLQQAEKFEEMGAIHHAYIYRRSQSYMQNETGNITAPEVQNVQDQTVNLGYAELALNLIEGLIGGKPRRLIVNIPNHGSISGMNPEDVVEIPAWISKDSIQPVAIGQIPDGCLGLMKQVKTYEKLTIQAALQNSYRTAVNALATHPLVSDYPSAIQLVDGYMQAHGDYFPQLK